MPRRIGPWRGPAELENMKEKMERLFEESVGKGWGLRGWPALKRFEAMKRAQEWAASPRIDVFEEENEVVVKAEVPGLERENIELSLEGDTLTIKGEKKKEEKLEDEDYFYCERYYGAFSRRVELPTEVQTDKVKATLKNGVLEVRLPKTETAKKKEQKIKVE